MRKDMYVWNEPMEFNDGKDVFNWKGDDFREFEVKIVLELWGNVVADERDSLAYPCISFFCAYPCVIFVCVCFVFSLWKDHMIIHE